MLINMAQQEECRIAVVENGQLEELYFERAGTSSIVGNFYKGKITNVEPSIQACFVDFGIGKSGFLHISDVRSRYFEGKKSAKEHVGRKKPRRERPPIQDCLKRGQELVVQVTREGIGTKGPTLTTYLSIPGRYLVLMPGMNRTGISRKIEDENARSRLRELLKQLKPPRDLGFIVRTAGVDRNKRDLQRDLNYLLRLWKNINKHIEKDPPGTVLYQESDLVIRTIRDIFNSDIKRIVCDAETTAKKIRDFIRIAMPRTRSRVNLYEGKEPLFSQYGIEEEIEKIQSRDVALKSGGSLVIDSTEAIVAIDVNSGKYRAHGDAETTAFKINMEAAPQIARHLRLRDLGGVVIIDFIDMMELKHRRAVEKNLRDALSTDRARIKVLRISQLGIVEMTRQRMRPSLARSNYMDCPHCRGAGLIKNPESTSIEIMRAIQSLIDKPQVASLEIEASPAVASVLQNRKRAALVEFEQSYQKQISIDVNSEFSNDVINIVSRDSRGSLINCSK